MGAAVPAMRTATQAGCAAVLALRAATQPRLVAVLLLCLIAFSPGCRATKSAQSVERPATHPSLSEPIIWPAVAARVSPPIGWRVDPLKSTSSHKHQVWISPSGNTAFGVILFNLPLPLGSETVLWGFMREMRKSEGTAELISKTPDPKLPGTRFVAKGGIYTVRTNLITRGFKGWAVYAGTRTQNPVDVDELNLAEASRERAVVGVSE